MEEKQIERRRFFRLDDQLLLAFAPLPANKAHLQPRSQDDARDIMELEIGSLLSQLRSTQPGTARLIELLNQKLNHILLVNELPVHDMPEQVLTNVNLSACGMRFLTDTNLHHESHLRLYMTLFPTHTPLCLIGRLVSIEDNPEYSSTAANPRWLIRLTFEPIFDSDQEQLIQHMLRLQSRQLGARLRQPQ
jgi:hypothetical protein